RPSRSTPIPYTTLFRSVPPRILEQPHQVEGVADALGAEAEVLVELADPLGVEVDVEQLPVPQRLRDAVREVQAGHRLVGELGVEDRKSTRLNSSHVKIS